MSEYKQRRMICCAMSAGCVVAIIELIRAEVGDPSWIHFGRGIGVAIALSLLVFFVICLLDD